MKVFCKDCKHYLYDDDPQLPSYWCAAPKNCTDVIKYDRIYLRPKKKPRKLNKNNNCPWYEAK